MMTLQASSRPVSGLCSKPGASRPQRLSVLQRPGQQRMQPLQVRNTPYREPHGGHLAFGLAETNRRPHHNHNVGQCKRREPVAQPGPHLRPRGQKLLADTAGVHGPQARRWWCAWLLVCFCTGFHVGFLMLACLPMRTACSCNAGFAHARLLLLPRSRQAHCRAQCSPLPTAHVRRCRLTFSPASRSG